MAVPSTQEAKLTQLTQLIQLAQLDPHILNPFLTIADISLANNNNTFISLCNYLDYLESRYYLEDISITRDKIRAIAYIMLGVIKFINTYLPENEANAIRLNMAYLLFNRTQYILTTPTTNSNVTNNEGIP
jgi:hypothetical protein